MKLAEELGRRRDEVSTHQKVRGPGVGVGRAAVCRLLAGLAGAAWGQLRPALQGVRCARRDVP